MHSDHDKRDHQLVIDSVVSTQPELGPCIPEGGYGWFVFLATLFFQGLIPSLTVSFGIFLAYTRLPNLSNMDLNPKLWDDHFMYAPLLFIASWTIFDPTSRYLISNSTWPRLVATAGTCLTCAGLLFLWMGIAETSGTILFPLAGIVCGIGSSIQTSQCEILLAQYFRIKLPMLANVCQAVAALGFVVVPIVIGHHVFNSTLLHVVMWYQAVILQGLIFNLIFKKPAYLKSKHRDTYKYVTSTPDDEEDIFSKNAKELQIKRQNSTGTRVTIEKHTLSTTEEHKPSEPSGSGTNNNLRKNWVNFEEKEDAEPNKYEILNQDWETFDDEDEPEQKPKKKWIDFQDEPKNSLNLEQEISFSENKINLGPTTNISGIPIPLFSDLPVNNNSTYSYDIIEQDSQQIAPAVFMPTTIQKPRMLSDRLEILKQPTFYKSLLTVLTTKFSLFVYYSLFPLYIYQELPNTQMKELSTLVGLLSLTNLFFTFVSHWINIDKKRRPVCFWALCWVGAAGYFMIADSSSKTVLIFGAIQVLVSISTLQFIGMPILGLTVRGETNKEFALISVMSGAAFIFFICVDAYFKTCFKLMALLHFFTGAVWFSNYIYKKFKV